MFFGATLVRETKWGVFLPCAHTTVHSPLFARANVIRPSIYWHFSRNAELLKERERFEVSREFLGQSPSERERERGGEDGHLYKHQYNSGWAERGGTMRS